MSACFAPHAAHAFLDIEGRSCRGRRSAFPARGRPADTIEMARQIRRDELCAPRIDVTVSGAGLAVRVEALGDDKVQFVHRPRHGHVEKASFFLDFLARACGKVGRDAAVHHVQD